MSEKYPYTLRLMLVQNIHKESYPTRKRDGTAGFERELALFLCAVASQPWRAVLRNPASFYSAKTR
jgi:hypothetical protein